MDKIKITDNDKTVKDTDSKPSAGPSLSEMKLNSPWVLYLYDKQIFKKMTNKPTFDGKPYMEICVINTVNDMLYLIQLMGVKYDSKIQLGSSSANSKLNLDMNDYIIMRKGIEPIWEDKHNANGGNFTIKISHNKGFDLWSKFIMYILGETLSPGEMNYINGITVSYISDNNVFHTSPNIKMNDADYTYLKIWDGNPNRSTKEEFLNILPMEIVEKIKHESLMYAKNNKKKGYGNQDLINKLNRQRDGGGRGRRNYNY